MTLAAAATTAAATTAAATTAAAGTSAADHALWYLSRATGIVSLVLLTVVVVLGLLVAGRGKLPATPRFVVAAVHRNAALLSMLLLAVHIVTAVVDPYVTIRWVDVVVPFGGSYKPLWVGLGAFGLDLLVAVVATSLVRLRLGLRTWRAVHWLTYLAWPVAVVHGFKTGTDLRAGWPLLLTAGCVAAVAVAVAWRLRDAGTRLPAPERPEALLAELDASSSRAVRR